MDQLSAAWRAGLGRESEDHLTAAGRWLLAHHERSDHSLWHKLADLSVAAATRIAGGAKVSRAQDSNVNRLATAVFAATGAQQPISQRLEVLMTAMMESSSKELRVRVLNFLGARATIGADWRQRILRLANSTGLASERARAVLESSLRLTVDELERLAAASPSGSEVAYRQFLSSLAAGQAAYVRRSLGKFGAPALVDACVYLERALDPAAVPELLDLLRSSRESVREAATTALRAIRFHREQQEYWAGGAGAVAQSVAALQRLQQQAAPGEPKAQRLLAIRAIAALRRPTALPSLIELSAETDAEIAAAALAAIDALSSLGPESGK